MLIFSDKVNHSNIPVLEGGASGHMAHLFEDPYLTFANLQTIFTKLFSGNLEIEEKTDGQALAITVKYGQVLAARNKATLRDPMTLAQLATKFEGRGAISEAFVKSMTDISSAIETLSEKEIDTIFKNGLNFMAFEIIYPSTQNVIDYGGRCLIQLHGINEYDENFNKIGENKKLADKLFAYFKANDALKQKTFEITNHTKLQLKNSKTSQDALDIIIPKLKTVAKPVGMNATILSYTTKFITDSIYKYSSAIGLDLSKAPKFVEALASNLNYIAPKAKSKREVKAEAKAYNLNTEDSSFLITSLGEYSPELNRRAISPIEDLVIEAGLLLMKNLLGFISINPSKTAKSLHKELVTTIDTLTSNEASLTDAKRATFKKNLEKLNRYQNEVNPAEGLVFKYKNKIYKLTGTFGAINQLLGILRY